MSTGSGALTSQERNSFDPILNPFGDDLLKFLETDNFTISNEDLDLFTISASPIDSSLWYKILPYRFLLLKASPGEKVGQTKYDLVGSYVLPIGPQNLSYGIPFAALNTPLADGMLVEVNGAPLRTIEISGTTGFLPYRASSAPSSSGFGGQTANAASNLASNFSGKSAGPDPDNSGYALFHKLLQFFEVWANISKDANNNNLRIAFDMPKDNVTFLITPKSFSLVRDVDSPMLYRYSISLEAWGKCIIEGVTGKTPALQPGSPLSNPSTLTKIYQGIQQGQRVINQAANVIKAVRSDVNSVLNGVRQVSLAVKSVLNIASNLADMPESIVQGLAGSLASSWNNVSSAAIQAGASIDALSKTNFAKVFQSSINQYGTQGNLLPAQVKSPSVANINSGTVGGSNPAGTLKSNGTANINNPAGTNQNPYSNPSAQLSGILSNKSQNYDLLTAININNLNNIPQLIQSKIDKEYAQVNAFTRKDFQNVRDQVNTLSRAMSAYFGENTPDYDKYYSDVPNKVGIVNNKLNRSQMDILIALRQVASNLDLLCAQNRNTKTDIDLSFNYVGSLLAGSGISFQESANKFQAPVPFGMSMAQISNLYLGDPNRVNEIVILNNLSPPYIDENGKTQQLLVNATNQSFVIRDGSELVLDQGVVLSSNAVNPFRVLIKKILKINNNEWLITIQNNINLNNLKTTDKAQIQYFQNGTVNSNNIIWIPTNNINLANLPDKLKPVTFIPNSDGLQGLSKIDFLLTAGNDLAINSLGQLGLASGLANLNQALRLKVLTPKGGNFFHPTYGAGVQIGATTVASQIPQLKNNFILAIQQDPRYSEVLGLSVSLQNGVIFLQGNVVLAGVSRSLPFNFSI